MTVFAEKRETALDLQNDPALQKAMMLLPPPDAAAAATVNVKIETGAAPVPAITVKPAPAAPIPDTAAEVASPQRHMKINWNPITNQAAISLLQEWALTNQTVVLSIHFAKHVVTHHTGQLHIEDVSRVNLISPYDQHVSVDAASYQDFLTGDGWKTVGRNEARCPNCRACARRASRC